MNLKVGDIINHRSLGLMILTDEYVKEASFLQGMHGKALFYMEKLNSEPGSNKWILYEPSITNYKVTLATDEDIIQALIDDLCTITISNVHKIWIQPKEKSMYLYTDYGDGISFNKEQIKNLKKQLEEINV